MAAAGIIAGRIVGRIMINKIKEDALLKEKLAVYRSASIVKWALLEGPSLFAIVCFIITSDFYFLGVSAMIMVWFVINRPTRDRTILDLGLEMHEKLMLEEPDAIVAESP